MVLQRDIPLDELIDSIPGTANKIFKRNTIRFFSVIAWTKQIFAGSIGRELEITEISLNAKAEESKKLEARVVCEMDVTEGILYALCIHANNQRRFNYSLKPDMLNFDGNMHGGCSAYVVDV